MLEINGNSYRLCLLDTNAVSEMVKNPDREFSTFLECLLPRGHTPCFSLFSILELRQRTDVYGRFLDYFSVFPSLVLKSHQQLLCDEIARYPDPIGLDPVLLAPVAMRLPAGQSRREALEWLLDSPAISIDGEKWLDLRGDTLEGLIEHVPNFQPKGRSYLASEIRFFLEVVTLQQIAMHDYNFVSQTLARGKPVAIDAFPSVKMIAYTVFHKFYRDRGRKPTRSDVFDILISTLLPYVDAVITERHQAEVVRQVSAHDDCLKHLEVWTLRELRLGGISSA